MKLAIILPGDYGKEVCQRREKYYKQFCGSGTEIEVLTTGGTKSITSTIDFALVAPGALQKAIEAERKGFDGIVLQAL
jgi:Asp/Glu/hydantoin racemase